MWWKKFKDLLAQLWSGQWPMFLGHSFHQIDKNGILFWAQVGSTPHFGGSIFVLNPSGHSGFVHIKVFGHNNIATAIHSYQVSCLICDVRACTDARLCEKHWRNAHGVSRDLDTMRTWHKKRLFLSLFLFRHVSCSCFFLCVCVSGLVFGFCVCVYHKLNVLSNLSKKQNSRQGC